MEDTTKWEQAMDDRMSRLQKMRCTKAKYVAIAEAGNERIWMTNYLEELGKKQHKKILYRDS